MHKFYLRRDDLHNLLQENELLQNLKAFNFSRFTICSDTLSICRPAMKRLCDEPANGWMAAAYEYLAYAIYPAEEHAAESKPLACALKFYLTVLMAVIRHEASLREFDPLFDVDLLSPDDYQSSRIADEYAAFVQAVEESGYIPLLHLTRECQPFNALAHTAGVHHVALHMARQMRRCGVPADIALVSASALSHDIGKFGCRHDDAQRIPYLHYFYTDQWLCKYNLPHIAHVAANHSTWDLEYENLPAESLVLIYADFRVRGERVGNAEKTTIFSLQQAGDIVLHKLANVDEIKYRRYRLVYEKLWDFQSYLSKRGVNPDITSDDLLPVDNLSTALLDNQQTIEELKYFAVEHNLLLMESISVSASFELLLERARSEKNLGSIRTYLNLFEEYYAYMTRSHKLQILSFLYELLMHHERDVRRQAAHLMGLILANSGLQYRKELPVHAPETAIAPTLSEMLAECAELWESFLALLIEPDNTIEKRLSLRVKNSLKIVAGSLLSNCKKTDVRMYLEPLLHWFRQPPTDCFALCDTITHIPLDCFSIEELQLLIHFIEPMIQNDNEREQICALRAYEYLAAQRRADVSQYLQSCLAQTDFSLGSTHYLADKLQNMLENRVSIQTEVRISDLYLDNLKATVHWIIKVANIDRLAAYAVRNSTEAYHVATHFSNLLLISEHLPVREHAGNALLSMAGLLSVEETNEIVIDLCRGLESGQAEFSRNVSPYLASLIRLLPSGQADETISLLETNVRSPNVSASCSALSAIGAFLTLLLKEDQVDGESKCLQMRVVSIIMAGLAHFEDEVHRTALMVFCRDIFGNQDIPLARRRDLFICVSKKLLTICSERTQNEITFLNTSAMLNHLYRMMLECEVDIGAFVFPEPGDVAFFPGTFDPFSDGHKRIVTEIRARGFEVYLAVDEFSWSKRTQPKLLRRQIALMSLADCLGVYLFPDDIPINIANPADLKRLKGLFPGRELYLVAGSDVIENASAYTNADSADNVCSFNHIVFRRSHLNDEEGKSTLRPCLTGKVIELSLPTYYEDVSSSRIRESIDKNLEISTMVDPVAEAFIHQKGLYLRTPQYKRLLHPEDYAYQISDHAGIDAMSGLNNLQHDFSPLMLEALQEKKAFVVSQKTADYCAVVYAYSISLAQLFNVLGNLEQAEYVRMQASGKILVIDGAKAQDQMILTDLVNELLTFSLSSDHTYAIYRRSPGDEMLVNTLMEKGFILAGSDELLLVDMRAPLVVTCDAFMMLKEPYASDHEIVRCILDARKRLLTELCNTFPSSLILAFDTRHINHMLIQKVEQYNKVLGLPEKPRKLGPYMCVPYGKILSDVVVPNTVTKTLHVEKVFAPDIRQFSIEEARDYSSLKNQLAVIHSFNRSVLLVDDLLHNGYRLEKLDPLFIQEDVYIEKILVGILSGRGKDLMDTQKRSVDTVYWIPNLRYWFTESLMYPFIGGDSVRRKDENGVSTLPSINLIMPYNSLAFMRDVSTAKKRALSMTALRNAYDIMHTLEQRHKELYRRSLTITRLGEALQLPRLPDRGSVTRYDGSVPASAYIRDDIDRMLRLM